MQQKSPDETSFGSQTKIKTRYREQGPDDWDIFPKGNEVGEIHDLMEVDKVEVHMTEAVGLIPQLDITIEGATTRPDVFNVIHDNRYLFKGTRVYVSRSEVIHSPSRRRSGDHKPNELTYLRVFLKYDRTERGKRLTP